MAVKSGDSCSCCKRARLGVVRSCAAGQYQIRYLKCPKCGARERSVVAADNIRRRGVVS